MSLIAQLSGRAVTDPRIIEAKKKKIQTVINANLDIRRTINEGVGAKRPRTERGLESARIKAIQAAIKKNLTFAKAVREAVRETD
jgi:hypothetical protein